MSKKHKSVHTGLLAEEVIVSGAESSISYTYYYWHK